jgi:hypothetical protein
MKRLSAGVVLLAVACGGSALSPQEKAERCQGFAGAVAVAHLRTTPSEQVARDVASSLDNRLSRLGTVELHTPAVQVHRYLHAIESAQRRGDAEAADKAAERARRAVSELARACDLPESDFLD